MVVPLVDLLRALPDADLAALLRLRPDLVVPVPADLSALAARIRSRTSVARVLDRLDRFHLEILDALRLTCDADGVTSMDAVLAVAAAPTGGADAGRVRDAVRHLRAYLLVWGEDDALQVVGTIAEVAGPYPAGLGRPAATLDAASAALVADPARLRRTLLSAPPAARAVLERLAAGPPVGSLTRGGGPGAHLAGNGMPAAGPEPAAGDAGTPAAGTPDGATQPGTAVEWLVSRGLLVPTSLTTVELPREVGLLLRRDTGPLGPLHPDPPEPAGEPLPQAAVDSAGAGQAMEVARQAEALLDALAAEPAPALRSAGLGIRDLRRLARAAGLTEPVAALLIEIGYAVGLIGEVEIAGAPARATGDSEFLPAAGFDGWRAAPVAARWHRLVTGWLTMTRQPGLIATRGDKDRLLAALSPDVERCAAPANRRLALGVLAGLPPGTAPAEPELLDLLAWHAPRRAAGWAAATRQILAEAAALGITGRGALTSYGREVVAGEDPTGDAEEPDDPLGRRSATRPAALPAAVAVLDRLLPPPVDHLVVQADLTVVVPGPPEPGLAAELELATELESAGGASVHRVTRDSVRRAMDAGYAAEQLHALFRRRSRTPVPQALTYLIDDVGRAHGGLRVGSAAAYLRSDDEALLAEVLADRRLAPLGLRRLAATVLVGSVSGGRLLAALRAAGYAPVPEDGAGAAVLARPRSRRAPARAPLAATVDPFDDARFGPVPGGLSRPAGPVRAGAAGPGLPRLLGIVEDIRRGDAAALARRAATRVIGSTARATNGHAISPVQAHTEAMAVLQQAVRDRARVWIGYIDSHGTTMSRLLRPVSIGAGYLRAEDDRTDTLHTFALHRITAATFE